MSTTTLVPDDCRAGAEIERFLRSVKMNLEGVLSPVLMAAVVQRLKHEEIYGSALLKTIKTILGHVFGPQCSHHRSQVLTDRLNGSSLPKVEPELRR